MQQQQTNRSHDLQDTRPIDSSELAALRNRIKGARAPVDREANIAHPATVPWVPGQPGFSDGTYEIEIMSFTVETLRNKRDQIVRTRFRILEIMDRPDYAKPDGGAWPSDDVTVGDEREHVIFLDKSDAAEGELNKMAEDRATFLRGVPGDMSDGEFAGMLTKTQTFRGVRARMTVRTTSQVKDRTKSWTHIRYRYLSTPAQRMAEMPITVAPTPASVLEAVARAKAGFVPPEAA